MGHGCTLATPTLVGCGVPREQGFEGRTTYSASTGFGVATSAKAQGPTGAKSGAPGWKAAAEQAAANSKARENDFALAKRVIEIWETRPSVPEEHVRKAAHALFAWHNCVVHPMLVSDPRVGQILHRITAEILIEVDPDYFYSELGPDGRRAYVPGGELPDNLEYQLAKRLMALLTARAEDPEIGKMVPAKVEDRRGAALEPLFIELRDKLSDALVQGNREQAKTFADQISTLEDILRGK